MHHLSIPATPIIWKGIERPVMKALEEEKEAENRRDTETRRKEPTRLSEWIDEENRDKNSNRPRERNSIVRTDSYETSKFKLSKHETNESKGSVERHKIPESPKLAASVDEIPLRLQGPKVEEENGP